MATEALKSPSITNRDAAIQVPNTAGSGAPGDLQINDDSLVTTSGVTVGSTYRICQVPSAAKVKMVLGSGKAMTVGAFDVGVYYAVGHKASAAGAVISAAFFASAWSLAADVQPTIITEESGTFTEDLYNKPLWQALGLASDPGGWFDIVATSTNTITTGARMRLGVEFVI